MNEQVKISSGESAEKQFLFADAPAWKEYKARELKELLEFIKTHEEKEKLARLVANAVSDKKTKRLPKEAGECWKTNCAKKGECMIASEKDMHYNRIKCAFAS